MTKLDKDQLDKITGGTAVTQQNENLQGGVTDDGSSDTLSQKNEDLEDNGSGGGGGQPGFGRNG